MLFKINQTVIFPAYCFAFFLLLQTCSIAEEKPSPITYNEHVRPILSSYCFSCHGRDEGSRKADLRLDTFEGATVDLGGHFGIAPNAPEKSTVIDRVKSSSASKVMPPEETGKSLSSEEVAILEQWIREGAVYQKHWSFIPPERKNLPAAKKQDWPKNPIDNFVLSKMQAHGLQPSKQADRHTLIRRLSLDLTGLPPTVAEVKAFVDDTHSDAYERLVDRLLASKKFGEHWARTWLDLARYADSRGYEKDRHRNMWRYRDWVINAINNDMPYDQFTIEQIAGDLLPNATMEQKLATAFHRNTMNNDEGGTDNEEFRVLAVKDRVDTTVQVWMGLTIGCAKCHSHKYDPISMNDYYSLFAFFNQTEDADRSDDAPLMATPTAKQLVQQHQMQKDYAAMEKEGDSKKKQLSALKKKLAKFKKSYVRIPVMRELPLKKHRKTHLHVRGNFLEKGERVQPELPASFGKLSKGDPKNRMSVAKWLVDSKNPLTARVTVNRFWARFFGVGIVETEEDFGTQGIPPSHPRLLDWLALEFRDTQNWSVKKLCKTIVMSATYQQASDVTKKQNLIDPRNKWLSRGARFRLPAEVIRDQALFTSGLLSKKMLGPSVMPPQPSGVWKATYSTVNWVTSKGENRYRRGLYTYWRRTSPYPSMLAFDAVSREVCSIRRIRTNTPLQALVTLNDTVYLEAAAALAKKMLHHTELNSKSNTENVRSQLTHGFKRVMCRSPREDEIQRLHQMYITAFERYKSHPEHAAKLLQTSNIKADTNVQELAAMTIVGNVLLNLDETLTRD